MVIGGFVIGIAVHGIGNTVVTYINKNKEIFTSDGFRDDSLGFSGTETIAGRVDNVIIGYIAFKGGIIFGNILNVSAETYKIVVDLIAESGGRIQYDKL